MIVNNPAELELVVERLARYVRTSDPGFRYERARLLSLVETGAVAVAGPWGDVIVRASPWDSNVLGIQTGRIEAFRTEDGSPDARSWAEALRVRHLSIRLPFTDVAGARILEQAGFRIADVSLSFVYKGDAPASYSGEVTIRAASERDSLVLTRIAREAFVATRFHLDPEIGRERGAAVYSRWIADALAGSADSVLVAELSGSPVGFATCKLDRLAPRAVGYGIGELDLLAVGGKGRGRGVGRALVDAALVYMLDKVRRVEVMTSASNSLAIRLYQRAGFTHESGIALSGGVTLHWWPET